MDNITRCVPSSYTKSELVVIGLSRLLETLKNILFNVQHKTRPDKTFMSVFLFVIEWVIHIELWVNFWKRNFRNIIFSQRNSWQSYWSGDIFPNFITIVRQKYKMSIWGRNWIYIWIIRVRNELKTEFTNEKEVFTK